MNNISISKDFSTALGGEFIKHGPYSGEQFRIDFLEPAMDKGEVFIVNMDGTYGIPHTFLRGAFRPLGIKYGPNNVYRLMKIQAFEESGVEDNISDIISGI